MGDEIYQTEFIAPPEPQKYEQNGSAHLMNGNGRHAVNNLHDTD